VSPRDLLFRSSGFHEFAKVPEAWRRPQQCYFCGKGERDGLKGLWGFHAYFICDDEVRTIVEHGKTPEMRRPERALTESKRYRRRRGKH